MSRNCTETRRKRRGCRKKGTHLPGPGGVLCILLILPVFWLICLNVSSPVFLWSAVQFRGPHLSVQVQLCALHHPHNADEVVPGMRDEEGWQAAAGPIQ